MKKLLNHIINYILKNKQGYEIIIPNYIVILPIDEIEFVAIDRKSKKVYLGTKEDYLELVNKPNVQKITLKS